MSNRERTPIQRETSREQMMRELNRKAQTINPTLKNEYREIAVHAAAQIVSIPQNDPNKGLWALAYDVEERALQTEEGTRILGNPSPYLTWNKDAFREPNEKIYRPYLAAILVQLDFAEKELSTKPSYQTNDAKLDTERLARELTIYTPVAFSPQKD